MANTVVTLRPDGGSTYTGTTVVGAADVQTALSDNSDASYLEIAAASIGGALVDFGTFTLPALAQVRSLTARARVALASAGTRGMMLTISYPLPAWTSPTLLAPTTTITTYTGNPATSGPTGPFSQLQINFMEVDLKSTVVGSVPLQRIYELYLDLAYNQVPVAAVTSPTGTVTTRSDPQIIWTYTDPEGDAQERYQVKIFTAAQYGIGGFDPETSPYTWWSGEVLSANVNVNPPPPLPNGTYRAYVKVADVGSSSRYCAWVFTGYVLNATVPPTPTLVATADTALSRIKLDTTVGTFAGGTQLVTVQRSLDAGVTWTTIRGATAVVTANLGTFTVWDYEMPRGVSVSYRSQVISIPAFGFASAYSTTATLTLTAAGWWLKDPQFPALNMLMDVAPSFTLRRKIPQTAYEGLGSTSTPAGSATATVVTDGARGYTGTLTVWSKTAERWAKLDTLIDTARPLLLEDNLGRAWYVQIGDASEWALNRAAPIAGETSPIRHFHSVVLPFTQVAAPSGTTQGAGTPTG